MRQICTYLINIKKLIKENNIESEDKDFFKLKTKNIKGSTKTDIAPSSQYLPESPQDKTLVFESRFETGNLLTAVKISDNEYDLVL